ncbi:unnamed protein product [Allacma fusca]|uniref:Uncharacterized protein n=1 Tax=Allacma fusca TaxID=39272 RepID=A0A8J2PI35_9HEXA|nr:unnamed protein product [Allacma fusca]
MTVVYYVVVVISSISLKVAFKNCGSLASRWLKRSANFFEELFIIQENRKKYKSYGTLRDFGQTSLTSLPKKSHE